MLKTRKKILATLLTIAVLANTSVTVLAASNDGWTEASQTEAAKSGNWDGWCAKWESIKKDPIQMSLTPGKNSSELNFAWYSKNGEPASRLKLGKKVDMSDASEIKVISSSAITGYKSNKATATNLQEGVTYYYSYQVNGKWGNAIPYKNQSTKNFSFMLAGDPQIGSSSSNTATGTTEKQGQENAVRNDSFNWNNTINTALKANSNLSFILSAGDQIQSKGKNSTFTGNEIEYTGFLCPEALKSLPVATSIGNHDSPSSNYSFHFNNPNASSLGSTPAGGDYYFSYGNALFIMLNTNNVNAEEHQKLIEQAINDNPKAKWRIVTVHQDIYGSGEHSNEPDVVDLRYRLIPVFEKNNIDVVFSGHDHTYSRSYILKGAVKDASKFISEDEFDDYVDGKTPIDSKYNNYLANIEDSKSIQNSSSEKDSIRNPKGIAYITANSASGSKYYGLVPHKQAYIASRWQGDVPTYSIIDINDNSFTINTYRTDNKQKIDDTFSIIKTSEEKPSNTTADSSVSQSNTSTAKANSSSVSNSENNTTAIGNVKTGDDFSIYPIVILILAVSGLVYINRNTIVNGYKKLKKSN